ncbi:MAG: glycosyltransferase family 4 protein [Candidatus Bathyarchaeia archaeon]
MPPLRICVNSQTPLIRFNLTPEELARRYGKTSAPLDLGCLAEGRDYQFTPGGVTRMVFPLLKRMLGEGILEEAHWVSLNPTGPAEVRADGIALHHVSLAGDRMRGYGHVKEAIWRIIHGMPLDLGSAAQILWQDEFSDYTYYNRLSAERILRLDKIHDFDLFYIHDFQQLPIGYMLRTLKPKVFRWHIPFDASMIPQEWRELLSTYFNSYDIVIVSCRRYLEALKSFGYAGEARYVYPYIDPSPYAKPTEAEIAELCRGLGIREGDRVVLVVARLDPMKGQDRAIRAIAEVAKEIPNVKLLLVGDGSFSSSRQGIGLSKAEMWAGELRALAKGLGVEDRVIFAGHLAQSQLNAAYARCDLTVLPSIREGFGLVVIESWLYGKPAIVTSRAGVAELIEDGRNGLLFDPDDPIDLADKISSLLLDFERARTLGEKGLETSRGCLIDRGVKEESEIILGMV